MSTTRIIVAEDDPNIREGLVVALESEGYEVDAVANGRAALESCERQRPDLLLLDVMMPELSGYDVCRTLRAGDPALPIIMLTAKGEEIDKVVGLQLGADDYVTKPFGLHELLARIQAVLRRAQVNPAAAADVAASFRIGCADVDARTYRVTVGRKASDLSARELALLTEFAAHPDEVLSRDHLLNKVWGLTYYGTTRTLDQHVAKLRKKIADGTLNQHAIETIHGVGYRYRPSS